MKTTLTAALLLAIVFVNTRPTATPVPQLSAQGLITPFQTVDVAASVDGIIESIAVERGDLISKGQVLAKLESSVEKAAYDLAMARTEFNGELRTRRASLAFAETSLKQDEILYKKEIISVQDIEKSRTQKELAEAELLQAEENQRLARLNLDYVDILFLHDTEVGDLETQAQATGFPAIVELKEQGSVKAIGAGTRDIGVLTRLIQNFPVDVVLLPNHYSLLTQKPLDDFLPFCAENGVSIVLGTPYNSGILASDLTGPALFNYQNAPQELLDRARALKAICERHGADLKAAALQFVLAHPIVVSTIPGPASVAQLEDNVAMSQQPIPPVVWAEMKYEGLLRADAPTP